jgi:hypothetical protein
MAAMIDGSKATQLVRVAAMFSFAEYLATGTKTAEEIADAECLDPDATSRILRLCASFGLVTSEDGVRFSGTPTLATLGRNAPGSLRNQALVMGSATQWLPWGRLPEAVRTGKPQAAAALGTDVWSYLAARPEELSEVVAALDDNVARAASEEAARIIDTTGVSLAVDVGGANGSLLRALAVMNPELRGVVLDLPNAVAHAEHEIERAGLQDRLSAVAGDFFERVPEADLYLLRYILHDWDDESCNRILNCLRRTLLPGGRLMILEMVLGAMGEPPMVPLMDINMMAVLGGRERTLAQYEALLRFADFRLVKSAPMAVSARLAYRPVQVIEAKRI